MDVSQDARFKIQIFFILLLDFDCLLWLDTMPLGTSPLLRAVATVILWLPNTQRQALRWAEWHS